MPCMGFGDKWCKWILACLKSATISILINDSPTKEFSLGYGVRQGDPLSPFLFILVAVGLNILTKAAVECGLFNGVQIGKDKILVSHLQIADDTMFLGEWSNTNARNLINILKCFEQAWGQKVNFHKSCVYGVGVTLSEIDRLASGMGCQAEFFLFIYLGLPIGQSGAALVLHTVPGVPDSGQNVATAPSLQPSNNAVVPNDLVASPHVLLSPFNFAGKVNSDSIESSPVIALSTHPHSTHPCICTNAPSHQSILFLWNWTREPTGRTLNELIEVHNLVKSIRLDLKSNESMSWSFANNGVFTVKKLSSLLDEHILEVPNGSPNPTLGNNLIPKKLKIFVWRVLKKRIPVWIELDKRGIDLHSVHCPVCDDDLESVDHLLIKCKEALDVWNRIFKWWNLGSCSLSNMSDILHGKSSHHMSPFGKKNMASR
ncbi:uncharacterized protein [Rutidosis leptorrhynchoides]|uniref:uncharacterized protein n=1 Tax=Rutidosis leptorrhynchoides TaxID=125765 RepID=UPI003A9947CC